jgi:hypothetical protein
MEDPYIRQEYESRLAKNGVQSRMNASWYVKPEKNVGDSVV